MKRRTWAMIGVAVATGSILAWQHWHARAPVAHYVTAAATQGDIQRTIITTGTVNPLATVQVGTYVSGTIRELHCDYNTQVKAGQLCAKIDPRPYQVVYDQAAANLASAEAQLVKDRAVATAAQATWARDQALSAQGIVSAEALEADVSARDQAVAQVTLDRASIDQRRAALDAAKVNLNYTDIVSPVDGTVVSRSIDVGQTVAASFQTPTLFLIAKDLTRMQVDTNVSESDISGAKVGQKALFRVEAFPDQTFEGEVIQVRQAPMTVQNVVTYDVVVGVRNPRFQLFPGMTATTRIVTAEHHDVLRVPLAALRFTPTAATGEDGAVQDGARPADAPRGASGGTSSNPRQDAGATAQRDTHDDADEAGTNTTRGQVFVLRDGHPQRLAVTVGLTDATHAEVAGAGLAPGTEVIVGKAKPRGESAPRRSLLRF